MCVRVTAMPDLPGNSHGTDMSPAGHGPESVRKWLRYATVEGALANVFITFTGGAFVTGLALLLGASDFEIGLLAAIPFLAQVAQLLTAYFIGRFKTRKGVVVWLSVVGRQSWWVVPAVLLFSGGWRLEVLLAVVFFSNVAVMIATPGWMSWMADIVPEKVRGRYFGVRSAALAVSTVTSVLTGGLILDYFKNQGHESTGFIIITILSCLFAGAAAMLLNRIPDSSGKDYRMDFSRSRMIEPLTDKRFQRLLYVFFAWNVSIGIAAPFFAPHMLTNLKMSFTLISIYSSVASAAAIILNKPWGALIDRFGSKPVVAFCAFGIGIVPLIWVFPRSDFLSPLAFEAVYSGALWTGFILAAFNIPIANSPQENRTMYLAMFSVVTGLAFFASSLLGGVIAEALSSVRWKIGAQTIINYHVLFAVSGLMRIGAAFLMLTFHEPKEKGLPVMIQFMGYAFLKRLSGGRHMFPWPLKRTKVTDYTAKTLCRGSEI